MSIEIPQLNWFESNPWAKVGNCFTGSVGADRIENNGFLFRINYYRPEDGDAFLTAEVYDSKIKLEKDDEKIIKKDFIGTNEGREELVSWIEMQLEEFKKSGKSKEKISLNS